MCVFPQKSEITKFTPKSIKLLILKSGLLEELMSKVKLMLLYKVGSPFPMIMMICKLKGLIIIKCLQFYIKMLVVLLLSEA